MFGFNKKCLCSSFPKGATTQESTDKRLKALEEQNRILWRHLKIWLRPSNDNWELIEQGKGLVGEAFSAQLGVSTPSSKKTK